MSGGPLITDASPLSTAGHTVLAIPVFVLDEPVRARTASYDTSFVSTDPTFAHAHITVLAPWVPQPTPTDLDLVAQTIASLGLDPVTIELSQVRQFSNGLIYLAPEPAHTITALTTALATAFADYVPYGGEFPNPEPHLTLDHTAGGVTLDQARARVADFLPAYVELNRLDLQWWANNDCRRLHSWSW